MSEKTAELGLAMNTDLPGRGIYEHWVEEGRSVLRREFVPLRNRDSQRTFAGFPDGFSFSGSSMVGAGSARPTNTKKANSLTRASSCLRARVRGVDHDRHHLDLGP